MHDPTDALAHQARHAGEYLVDLCSLVRVPSVSAPAFPPVEVRRGALAVAELLERRGFEHVALLERDGAHPCVYGDLLRDPRLPTLLLYAHYDVQPPGDERVWRSPPFDPVERAGRLYGRGAADDKAGIVVHAAAVESWLRGRGELPLNVRLLVEGEEEVNSPHLPEFLRAYRHLLAADALVLTDTGNIATGWPSITTSLRGLVTIAVEVRALARSVHSGIWGGAVPDPALALAFMLSSLVRSDGSIAVPGLCDQARAPSASERRSLEQLPVTRDAFRTLAGTLPGVNLLGTKHPCEATWYAPALTIDALQASSRDEARDVVNDRAWARVSVRLVPDMEPNEVAEKLTSALRHATPWGLDVAFEVEAAITPWRADIEHPAFGAALRALSNGYGREALMIGCGASIGFVAPLVAALGRIPAMLVGVADPESRVHSEDESLNLRDLERATRSMILMYAELADALQR